MCFTESVCDCVLASVFTFHVYHALPGHTDHTCYSQGRTEPDPDSAVEGGRTLQFAEEFCSFDSASVPTCGKWWVQIVEDCQGIGRCLAQISEAQDIAVNLGSGEMPVVSWVSSWLRSGDDFHTSVLLILHECETEFDALAGCSKCNSPYYEATYMKDIEGHRVYEYAESKQYCRPQPNLFEEECEKDGFCPKGPPAGECEPDQFCPDNPFTDLRYWSCRTNFNGQQETETGTQSKSQPITQGFGCVAP